MGRSSQAGLGGQLRTYRAGVETGGALRISGAGGDGLQWIWGGSRKEQLWGLVGGADWVLPMVPVALQTETLLLQAERRALCTCWPTGR